MPIPAAELPQQEFFVNSRKYYLTSGRSDAIFMSVIITIIKIE